MKTLTIILSLTVTTHCALALSISNFSTQSIDFNDYTGAGFQSTPTTGQLDSDDWSIEGLSDGNLAHGSSATTGDFARGTRSGGVGTGGLYAFEVAANDHAFGFQATEGDLTPGRFTLKLSNATGATITSLEIAYNIYSYNDHARSNSLNFQHSPDNTNMASEASLDFASIESAASEPSWTSTKKTITLSNLSWANGANYYLHWTTDDVSGSGTRDELALDNIEFTPVPEWSQYSSLLAIAALFFATQRRP